MTWINFSKTSSPIIKIVPGVSQTSIKNFLPENIELNVSNQVSQDNLYAEYLFSFQNKSEFNYLIINRPQFAQNLNLPNYFDTLHDKDIITIENFNNSNATGNSANKTVHDCKRFYISGYSSTAGKFIKSIGDSFSVFSNANMTRKIKVDISSPVLNQPSLITKQAQIFIRTK